MFFAFIKKKSCLRYYIPQILVKSGVKGADPTFCSKPDARVKLDEKYALGSSLNDLTAKHPPRLRKTKNIDF